MRPDFGRVCSTGMIRPPHIHEIFHSLRHGVAGLPTITQILDKARIADR